MQPQGGWVQPHITFVSQIDLQLYFCISQVCFPSVFLKEERVGCGHLRPHLTCVSQLNLSAVFLYFSSVFLKCISQGGREGGMWPPGGWVRPHLTCVSQLDFCISQVCFSSVFLKEEKRVGCGHLEVGCGLTSPATGARHPPSAARESPVLPQWGRRLQPRS